MKQLFVFLLTLVMFTLFGCAKSSDNPAGGDDPPIDDPPTPVAVIVGYSFHIFGAVAHRITYTDSNGYTFSSPDVIDGYYEARMYPGEEFNQTAYGYTTIGHPLVITISVTLDGILYDEKGVNFNVHTPSAAKTLEISGTIS